MRACEQAAIASGRVTGLELMERAGQGVIAAVFEEWPQLSDRSKPEPSDAIREDAPKAVVLCGPGNNGGDGFVVARLLRALGWQVEVFFYGKVEKLPKDARTNFDQWIEHETVYSLGFPEVSAEDVERFVEAAYRMSGTALIVDALFGIGLNRGIAGLSEIFAYNDIEMSIGDRLMPARHVAVDLPSGMRADEPEPYTYLAWFLADLTVTFHQPKVAHFHDYTARSCGKVVVRDIGI